MTCIVGLINNGEVMMGGDSAGVSDNDITIRKDEKIFKIGEFIFGCTSSFRMIQLIRYKFNPPNISEMEDISHYMCTKFVDALRECFRKGGYMKYENNEETGGTFLVGFRGRLFKICSDFQVAESIDDFMTCGSGYAYALGSLYSTKDLFPSERIKIALNCAAYYNSGVRPPFIILNEK
jgi:ATP-dependent protease HslVU (ClpYQ) peptidase subunit